MMRRGKLLFNKLGLFLMLVFLPAFGLEAQSQGDIFVHRPPALNQLPSPMQPVELEVALRGVRDVGLEVRSFISRDGRVMDVAHTESYLSDHGDAVYRFVVSAPLAEMSYRFIVPDRDKAEFRTSRRFEVRRECLTETTPVELIETTTLTGRERLDTLLEMSRGLERDIDNYDRASQLLQEIKDLLHD